MLHLEIDVYKWSSYGNIICVSQKDPNSAAWFKQPLDVRVNAIFLVMGVTKLPCYVFLRCYIFLPLSQSFFRTLTIK